MDPLIENTAERIFADHVDTAVRQRAAAGEFPVALWSALRKAGLHLVGSAESGTSLADLFALLQVAGRHAVPLPLADLLMANAVAGHAGITVVMDDGYAPWARIADRVLDVDGRLCTQFEYSEDINIAGEPFDRVALGDCETVEVPAHFRELMALSRVALMAGALQQVLALSIDYATERQQFGRPIAKFQAVQHALAVLAGETAAATCACDGASAALDSAAFPLQAAAAKARAGEAAGSAVEIAHQVHGAMGFTHEHNLHQFTRRLMAWRDDHGRESQWQQRLGENIVAQGAGNAWDCIVRAI